MEGGRSAKEGREGNRKDIRVLYIARFVHILCGHILYGLMVPNNLPSDKKGRTTEDPWEKLGAGIWSDKCRKLGREDGKDTQRCASGRNAEPSKHAVEQALSAALSRGRPGWGAGCWFYGPASP